jgi:hypothetical protein
MKSKELKRQLSPWTRRRHRVHLFVLLIYFILPFPPLLHFNCETWQIHFFGTILVPGQFHIIALAIIFLCFSLVVSATFLGKVFCGWVCPQNIFIELLEAIQQQIKRRFPSYRKSIYFQRIIEFIFALSISILLAQTFLLYFTAANPIFLAACYGFIVLFFTYDIAILKHNFCKSACPYGLLQHSLTEKDSLHIVYEKRDSHPCQSCHACEKACYVDLDIKKQPQHMDCTLCGACVDACAWVFSKKPTTPLLSFSKGKKSSHSLGKKMIFILFIAYTVTFIYLWIERPTYSFYLFAPTGNVSQQLPYQENGTTYNTYWLRLNNLCADTQEYSFLVTNEKLEIKLEEVLVLSPYENLYREIKVKSTYIELPYLSEIHVELKRNHKLLEIKKMPFVRAN